MVKNVISFSGGKDSLATLLLVKNIYGMRNTEVVFCDTGWEHELTYQHIDDVQKKIKKKFIILKSKKYDGFEDMSIKKKRVASPKARFCTEELKVKPMIDWILEQKHHLIIYQGIRRQESSARATMSAECTYFRFYFNPKKTIVKDGKIINKFDTYRKKDVSAREQKFATDIVRPIFTWSAARVFEYIKQNGYTPNPLYFQGYARVGCFPCIMSRQSEIKLINEKHPGTIKKIRNLEATLQRSFFPSNYIPKWACKNQQFPMIDDVINYVGDDPKQGTVGFEARTCESVYNICE